MDSIEWSLIGEIVSPTPNFEKIKNILNSGTFNPKGKDNLGIPYLVLATSRKQYEVAKMLVPYVDVNLQDDQQGRTALMTLRGMTMSNL